MASPLPRLLAELAAAFPRQQLSPQTVAIYVRELADLPADVLENAVRELIRTRDFPPSINEIRTACAERMLDLPADGDALAQIDARILWGRTDEAARPVAPPAVHPLVKECLDHVGGFYAYKTAEKPEVTRAQFLRLYRDARERLVREAKLGQVALPASTS